MTECLHFDGSLNLVRMEMDDMDLRDLSVDQLYEYKKFMVFLFVKKLQVKYLWVGIL